ncbi:hypothetical protein CIY_00630 [Butyrivibrio fibrisolvens 16/4]|nr:hypothetical protein CIY_00630 [Butyrivibrio fibrisolvens 16/4]
MDILKLNKNNIYKFAIAIAEKASSYIDDSETVEIINESLEVCKKWTQEGGNVGESLYDYLDNEENGFTIFQEMEESERVINAWDCIIDAIAYISKAAYEKEGVEYLPEPIELVDDSILSHMIQALILCDDKEQEYIEKLYSELS